MHRSGTSAVAGCLQRLGVDFGPRLMPPTPDNARGFYEHIDIVNLHDRLLLAAGSHWDDPAPRSPEWLSTERTARFREDLRMLLRRDFPSAPLWGLKDPRLCRLLPWWQPLWAEFQTEPLFVIVLRDPREIAASLGRRDGFSAGKAYRLWLDHILAAERDTRQAKRVFLDFAGFLANWRQALAPVGALLGQPWPILPENSAAGGGEPFVDGSLTRARELAAPGDVPSWVEEVDSAVRQQRLAGSELSKVLDRVATQVEAAQSLYGSAEERVGDHAREYTALREQARWYEAEWQKARKGWEGSRAKLMKRSEEAEAAKNRILALETMLADMRMAKLSDVRKRRGLWARVCRAFWPF